VKHLYPLLLLLMVPCLMFPGALPGPNIVSADDHLSVHHAFQSEAGGSVRHPHLSDPALQFKALRKAVRQSISEGEAPLWNPDIWAGAPLLGDAQSMVGSPFTWILLLLGEQNGADVAVAWLLLWIGFGSALLVRTLGGGVWGMAIAGAGAMTSPYLSVWLLHPHGATIVWFPWVLLALERRSHWGLALTTAGLLLGGHPQTAVHVLGITLAWWVWRIRSPKALVSMLTGALIAAPVLAPFIEEVARSATLAHHGSGDVLPIQLLDLIWPGWHGHPATETWTLRHLSWSDGRLHPGLGILALALWAFRKGHPLARGIFILWGVCIACSVVGLPGPIKHARLGSIGALLLVFLAGCLPLRRWPAALFGVVVTTGIWAGLHDQGSLPPERHDPASAPWTQKLKSIVDDGRVIGLSWALQPNTGALAGLADLRGYDLPVSTDTERLQMALNPHPIRPWFRIDTMPALPLLRFASVRAVLSTEAMTPEMDLGEAPLFAQRVEGSMPRVWLATGARSVDTPDQAMAWIQRDAKAPSRPPVEKLSHTLGLEGTVHPVDDLRITPRTVSFTAQSSSEAIAVISDAWHPGWTVEVNQTPATSLRVGGAFRGVMLPAGKSAIRWTFSPRSWFWGWILFGMGMLFLVSQQILGRLNTTTNSR